MRYLLLFVFVTMPAFAQDDGWIRDAYHTAYHLEKMGSYAKAVQALQPVVEAYPRGYAVNLRLGWLNHLYGKYAESEKYYRMAIQSAPGALEPRLGLLLPLLAQQRWDEVEQMAYQILKDDPCNYYGNLRLLEALRKQLKFDLARRQAEKMVALYPADTHFLTEQALALQGLGETEQAATILTDVEILMR